MNNGNEAPNSILKPEKDEEHHPSFITGQVESNPLEKKSSQPDQLNNFSSMTFNSGATLPDFSLTSIGSS